MPKEVAQAIGIIATVITILSFQQKKQRGIVFFQATSSAMWCIHFIMIGAYTGGILNLVATLRNLIMTKRDKYKWTGSPWFVVLMAVLSLGVYIVSFTVFNTPTTKTNLLLELLPALGIVVTTIAFREKEAKKVRLLSIMNSPLWLVYNAFNHSIGGVITETFCLISIGIGYLRHDRKE